MEFSKTKPKIGDLLGTEILVVATNFTSSVVHWMGEDRGASTDGYKNNAALGQLTLTNGVRGKIEFKGRPDGKNAIYIDYLEFSKQFLEWDNMIFLE